MRTRSTIIGCLLIAIAGLGGCQTTPASEGPRRPARINHLAFFTLNDPADADALIADCDKLLANIPGVVSYYCGKHHDVGRDTVDGNYDVGFYVGFMTDEDYAAYVDHPDHIDVVTRWRPRWTSIRVLDVLDETP